MTVVPAALPRRPLPRRRTSPLLLVLLVVVFPHPPSARAAPTTHGVWTPAADWRLELAACPVTGSAHSSSSSSSSSCPGGCAASDICTPSPDADTHYNCSLGGGAVGSGGRPCRIVCPAGSTLSSACAGLSIECLDRQTGACLPPPRTTCAQTPVRCVVLQPPGNSSGNTCSRDGTTGPNCLACDTANDWVTLQGGNDDGTNRCDHCPGGPRVELGFLVCFLLCFTFCKVKIVILLCILKKHAANSTTAKSKKAKKATHAVAGAVKILVSYVQVIGSVAATFDATPWSGAFLNLSSFFNGFNLDFFRMFAGFGCDAQSSLALPPLEAMILHLSVPPIITSACLMAYGFLRIVVAKKYKDQNPKAMVELLWEATVKTILAVYGTLYP